MTQYLKPISIRHDYQYTCQIESFYQI